VVESDFGWCPDSKDERRIITGVKWSPAIENPFRSLGAYGESLDSVLAEQRSGRNEPIAREDPMAAGDGSGRGN